MRQILKQVTFLLPGLLTGIAGAVEPEKDTESFWENREDGWHWYEDPPADRVEEDPERPEPTSTAPTATTSQEPKPLSTAWIRENLPKLRDAAIDEPTNENVTAYFIAQRIMMDKAQVFSDKAQEITTTDPLLDENLRLPFASAAKMAYMRSANDAKERLINSLGETTALWVFYDETCTYCSKQIGPINHFKKTHNVKVEVIHKQGGAINGLDSDIRVRKAKGQFEALGINFTPAIVMVRPPDDLWLISQGFVAYTTLVDRVIAAANRFGLISEEQYFAAEPMSKGILRADQMEPVDDVDWNNPSDWVPHVREAISSAYGLANTSLEGDNNE